jgi:hypothetical protein
MFAAHGVPTIELRMGSLLTQAGSSPATFTVANLDADEAFLGIRLTALLTDDDAAADRIRRFCLPEPGASGFLLDASPRGLADDEPGLRGLVERAIKRAEATAQARKRAEEEEARPSFSLAWKRLFQSEEALPSPPPTIETGAETPTGRNPWLARLAEAEARHGDALQAIRRDAAEERARLEQQIAAAGKSQALTQERLDELEASLAQWSSRLDAARAETDAARAEAGDRAARETALETQLESARVESETLTDQLRRAQEARDLAFSDRARDESLRAEAALRESALRESIRDLESQLERLGKDRSRETIDNAAVLRELTVGRDTIAARLDEVQRELADEKDKARARLAEVEGAHQIALKSAEARLVETREAIEASRESERAAHAKSSLEAEAQRRGLEERMAELTRTLAQEKDEASRALIRLNEGEGANRIALQAAEARLSEARQEMAALKAAAALSTDTWMARLRSAEQASEAMTAALAARASEQAAFEKVARDSEAHRSVLEERIAELKEARDRVEAREATLLVRVSEVERSLSRLQDERDAALHRATELEGRQAKGRAPVDAQTPRGTQKEKRPSRMARVPDRDTEPKGAWATQRPAWEERAGESTDAAAPTASETTGSSAPGEGPSPVNPRPRKRETPAWVRTATAETANEAAAGAATARPLSLEDLQTVWSPAGADSAPTRAATPFPSFNPEYERETPAGNGAEPRPRGWLQGLTRRIRPGGT